MSPALQNVPRTNQYHLRIDCMSSGTVNILLNFLRGFYFKLTLHNTNISFVMECITVWKLLEILLSQIWDNLFYRGVIWVERHIDGLVQDWSISIALAVEIPWWRHQMETCISCFPSICTSVSINYGIRRYSCGWFVSYFDLTKMALKLLRPVCRPGGRYWDC